MTLASLSAATDAVLFVDTSNAFNNLNRKVALLNIRFICPAIATILINCYRHHTVLFVDGSVLLSQEGTTQGDPLAIAMFALATLPLIAKMNADGSKQAGVADGAAAGGILQSLRSWWDTLGENGSSFGYYPNALNTYLVVKPGKEDQARKTFEGRRNLGGALGTHEFVEKFIPDKVSDWSSEVRRLTKFATTQPQASPKPLVQHTHMASSTDRPRGLRHL